MWNDTHDIKEKVFDLAVAHTYNSDGEMDPPDCVYNKPLPSTKPNAKQPYFSMKIVQGMAKRSIQ